MAGHVSRPISSTKHRQSPAIPRNRNSAQNSHSILVCPLEPKAAKQRLSSIRFNSRGPHVGPAPPSPSFSFPSHGSGDAANHCGQLCRGSICANHGAGHLAPSHVISRALRSCKCSHLHVHSEDPRGRRASLPSFCLNLPAQTSRHSRRVRLLQPILSFLHSRLDWQVLTHPLLPC